MKPINPLKQFLLSSAAIIACNASSQAAIVVTTVRSAQASPPTVSGSDLGQSATAVSSISATYGTGSTGGNTTVNLEPGQLFNGLTGNSDSDNADDGETIIGSGGSVTVNFNVTTNTLGYDITGISTYAGWSTIANGRSNQGYGITLTFMDNSTATLLAPTHWEPNPSTAQYWTVVSFANDGGGALSSNTVNLNGGGNVAGTDVVASGVKSMTFNGFFPANAGGFVVYREIDIFGTATAIPEPSSSALLGLGLLAAIGFRRRPA